MLGNFFMRLSSADFFPINLSKYSFRNTIKVSNSLDPDQEYILSVLIWVQTVCKVYLQTTKVPACKETVRAATKSLTHLCRMEFLIVMNWTSQFLILGLLCGIFHFYSNFKRNFCKQTVENLIRRRILPRLIWFCIVF